MREPISTLDVTHNIDEKALREARRVHHGRELFTSLRCQKCHATGITPKAGETMPELEMDAPSLADAGKRLNAAWIAHWLKNPQALRPDATMPQLLHGAAVEKDSADIAAFLDTLGALRPRAPPSTMRNSKWARITSRCR